MGPGGQVRCLTMWDPDGPGPLGQRVVVGGLFGTVGSIAVGGAAAWDPITSRWSGFGAGAPVAPQAVVAMPNGDLIVGGWAGGSAPSDPNCVARWDGTAWQPMGTSLPSMPGTPPGDVYALTTLSDGTLVAGGSFLGGVAIWTGTTWTSLGPGPGLGGPSVGWGGTVFTVAVRALLRRANGNLVATGKFDIAHGAVANNIAEWDGVAWHGFGSGLSAGSIDTGRALHELPNGDLLVTGAFANAGGVLVNSVARWDGVTWSAFGTGVQWPLGLGLSGTGPQAITSLPNGDIVVSGDLSDAGGVAVSGTARWNGTTWAPMGQGVRANALLTLPDGSVLAGGPFTTSSPSLGSRLARWDGTNWGSLTPIFDGGVRCAVATSDGDCFVGGDFRRIGATVCQQVAGLSGREWSALGSGVAVAMPRIPVVQSLAIDRDGSLIASGEFDFAGGVSAVRIARWDGAAWAPLGPVQSTLLSAPANDLLVHSSGDIIAGGPMGWAGGIVFFVARWDGVAWRSMAGGMNAAVNALLEAPNGDVIAGGEFTVAGGVPANHIAQWNGTAWSQVGPGLPARVRVLASLAGGTMLVAADSGVGVGSRVLAWDGSSFSQIGADFDGSVRAMIVLPNDDILVGGDFVTVGTTVCQHLARWSGGAWSAIGTGTDGPVHALALRRDGLLVVGGTFAYANGDRADYLATISPSCPPDSTFHGTGCAEAGGGQGLQPLTMPWVDSTLRAEATGLPTNALVITVTSLAFFEQAVVPLSLAFPSPAGCDLLVAPDIFGVLFATNGAVESTLFLPSVPPLAGATFFHQLLPFGIDAQGALMAPGATNALRLTVGQF